MVGVAEGSGHLTSMVWDLSGKHTTTRQSHTKPMNAFSEKRKPLSLSFSYMKSDMGKWLSLILPMVVWEWTRKCCECMLWCAFCIEWDVRHSFYSNKLLKVFLHELKVNYHNKWIVFSWSRGWQHLAHIIWAASIFITKCGCMACSQVLFSVARGVLQLHAIETTHNAADKKNECERKNKNKNKKIIKADAPL